MGKGSGGFGSVIQEYVGKWLKKQNISFLPNPKTGQYPDFKLMCDETDFYSQSAIPFEVKSFEKNGTAGSYDLGAAKKMTKELEVDPCGKLEEEYLVIGYTYDQEKQEVTIRSTGLVPLWRHAGIDQHLDGSLILRNQTKTANKHNEESEPKKNFQTLRPAKPGQRRPRNHKEFIECYANTMTCDSDEKNRWLANTKRNMKCPACSQSGET